MKKLSLSIAFALFFSVAFVSAQSLEEVLDNYFDANGQKTMLASKNSRTSGKMIQQGLEIPFDRYAAAPDKTRLEATFQGMTLIQTYNGKEGWNLNPFAGQTEPQAMNEDEIKAQKIEADYEGILWNWKEKGYTVSLEENEDVEGAECNVVKLVTDDGDEYISFIDAENYVTLKMHAKVTRQGKEVEVDTYMSNYQEGDGFVFPGKIVTKLGDQVISTVVVDSVMLDVELDSTIFEKPVK